VPQAVHDLAQRATGGSRQGAGGVAQVVDAQALDAGRSGGRLPDAAVEVAAPQVVPWLLRNTNASGDLAV
jgi:hypothetical protein